MTKKQDERRAIIEAKLGGLVVWAMVAFLIMMFVLSIFSCAGIRLPNRDHHLCKVPWENRKTCLDDSDCAFDHACARRGHAWGKCTYIDCCEPWRHGPRLLGPADWCRDLQTSEDK